MKRSILIIEDNQDVRMNIMELLEISNYEVSGAKNGLLGIEKALQNNYDLILCDVMMPELDGFGVLHILSKNEKTRDTPFIFLTAKTESIDFRKGMNLGADDYIFKPFDDTDLLDAVSLRLEKSDRNKKHFQRTQNINVFEAEKVSFEMLLDENDKNDLRIYDAKTHIFRENEKEKSVYFLKSGKIKIYKTNTQAKDKILNIIEPGRFFGYITTPENHKHVESAMCLTESEVVVISHEDFWMMVHNNRIFSKNFIEVLSNELATKEEDILTLAYDTVRKRVAQTLLMLDKKLTTNEKSNFQISREDLASIVGTAKESVIRVLSEFKKDEYISIVKNRIKILERLKLENQNF